MADASSITYVEAYYADSWVDAPALTNPKLAPRGFRAAGPFKQFSEALEHVPKYRREATHFKIRKVYVRSDLVTFITNELPPIINEAPYRG